MTTNQSLENLPVTQQDLPVWMRRAMRGNDWGALLTIGFSALVAWFFIINPSLPANNMTENYVYMTSDYAAAIQEGRLYPRWAPHAQGGYGAPIYHYYPPGAPYLAGMIQVLFTNDAITAVRLVYLLGFMLAGVGTYGVVVRHRGAPAAIIAAMLYVTSPYFGLTAPHILGDLPGILALGLLPVFLWSIDRQVSANYPQDFGFVSLTTAGLLLTDLHVAGAGFIIAAAMMLWRKIFKNKDPHYIRLTILANITGIVLASFYWIPLIAEQNLVQWETNALTTRPLFLTLSGLVARFRQIDPGALIPQQQLTLGWLRIMVAVLSLIGILTTQRRFSQDALFLSIGSILTALAIIFFPSEIWLLGVITLCFAVSSSAALSLRERFSAQTSRLILAISLLGILGASHPTWLPPAPALTTASPSPYRQTQYEQSGHGIAVVPAGKPYPTTLPGNIAYDSELLSSYPSNRINRVDRASLSGDLQVRIVSQSTHSAQYQLDISQPNQTLNLLLSAFPGWQARLSSERIPVNANSRGLVSVPLPPTAITNVQLNVWLGGTPARHAGWAASTLALITLILITRHRYNRATKQYHEITLLTQEEARLITVLFVFAILVVVLVARFDGQISIRIPNGTALKPTNLIGARTNVGINLVAYDINKTAFHHGDRLSLNLYWSALQELPENYRVQVVLVGKNDQGSLYKPVVRYPGGFAPTRWSPYQYVTDPHYIEISPNIPVGDYALVIMLENCDVNQIIICSPEGRPIFYQSNGQTSGQNFELIPNITITR